MTSAAIVDILVVEDAEAHAELIRRAFEPVGDRFHLRFAADLDQARGEIGVHLPGLVIADNRLPDGRGIELAVPGGDYPLVLMTSHGDEAVAVAAIKAGAVDYVVKKVEALLDLPHIAERALREWGHILERRRAEAELRQREVELRHAQKLEAIGRLASGVAHDFNNVLMGIAGCTDVAVRKLDADHPARQYLAEVIAAAHRASSITARLLAFGRRGELERTRVAIDALLGQVAAIARPLLPADIELELALAADDASVDGDAGQLEQVVLNLVTNARDAMPGGGRLTVATSVETGGDEELVVVRATDTGRGMDETTRARVFEPFFTTKELGHGTGLGLPTVYAIVSQHGGRVELDSAPGTGTTFRILLPRAAAESAARDDDRAGRAHARGGKPRRVLVVEDDPLVRAAVRHYLSEHGHDVTEAVDAADACRRLAANDHGVDLVVTDVVLPGGGGARVAEVARAARPAPPVLFMSAHPADVLHGEGRLPAGATVLQKPFTEATLVEAVDSTTPPTVLFVEDDRAARLAAAELLADAGFEVIALARGSEALAALAGRRFDVIVTDLGLPDLPGDELAARAREIDPSLPIVFVTGRSRHDPALHRALAAPATRVVIKPVEIDALIAAVRSVIPAAAK